MERVNRFKTRLAEARALLGASEWVPDFHTAALWQGKDAKWALKQWKRRERYLQRRDRPKTFVVAFEGEQNTESYIRIWSEVNYLIYTDSMYQYHQQEKANGERQGSR